MSDKPKRPWFRFHLLTAVLMMFAAGGLVWMLLPDWRLVADSLNNAPLEQFANPAKSPNPGDDRYEPWDLDPGTESKPTVFQQWHWFKVSHFWIIFILENIAAAFSFACGGGLIEYLLRRREGRKP